MVIRKIERKTEISCRECYAIAEVMIDGEKLCFRCARKRLSDLLMAFIEFDVKNRIVFRAGLNRLIKGGDADMEGTIKIDLKFYNEAINAL